MKSEKMDKAVARARGESAPEKTAEEKALALLTGDMSDQMQAFDINDLVALATSGEVEVAEQIIEIKEGMMIKGQLMGKGPDATIEDIATKKPKQVGTWRMTLESGARVTFLTAAQLDRMLPDFVGRVGVTTIARGGKSKTRNGGQMNNFFVFGPKANAPRLALPAAAGAEDLT